MASSKTTGSSKTSKHQKDTPAVSSKELQAGCMAHFRETLMKKGFSQKVLDILLSSWRKKPASQYESAWNKLNNLILNLTPENMTQHSRIE